MRQHDIIAGGPAHGQSFPVDIDTLPGLGGQTQGIHHIYGILLPHASDVQHHSIPQLYLCRAVL